MASSSPSRADSIAASSVSSARILIAPLPAGLARGVERLGRAAPLQVRHRRVRAIVLALEPFDVGDELAPSGIDGRTFVQRVDGSLAPAAQPRATLVDAVAKIDEIQHDR